MLSLDAEDRANLRRELWRTDEALDELMDVDRSAIVEDADDIAWRALQWFLDGVARVKEELQDVTKTVKQVR